MKADIEKVNILNNVPTKYEIIKSEDPQNLFI